MIAKNTWMCPNKTKPTEKSKQSAQLKWLLKHYYISYYNYMQRNGQTRKRNKGQQRHLEMLYQIWGQMPGLTQYKMI